MTSNGQWHHSGSGGGGSHDRHRGSNGGLVQPIPDDDSNSTIAPMTSDDRIMNDMEQGKTATSTPHPNFFRSKGYFKWAVLAVILVVVVMIVAVVAAVVSRNNKTDPNPAVSPNTPAPTLSFPTPAPTTSPTGNPGPVTPPTTPTPQPTPSPTVPVTQPTPPSTNDPGVTPSDIQVLTDFFLTGVSPDVTTQIVDSKYFGVFTVHIT
jgi:hypothetical protein